MRRWFAGTAALVCLGTVSAGASAQPPIDRARLEAFVDGAVIEGMQADRIAGMSVAVVGDGGVLLAKGYGRAATEPERAADADTLFRVGSISKTFTWIALMQQVEQGRLSLDDPINERLPDALAIPDEGFTQPIRVRHLMTHSAGFEDSVFGHLFTKDPERILPAPEYLVRYRVHRVREPGVLAVYSNFGATLAGEIVAQESGMPWQEYAEQRILRPLGMASATFREPYSEQVAARRGLPAPMPRELEARLAQGFQLDAGRLEAQPTEFVGPMASAGSLSASANDMARYMLALIDPARMQRAGVLRAETLLRMREPLHSNVEGLGPIRHGFLDYRLPGCKLALGHDGGLTLSHARMVVCPELGIGVFLAFNTPGGRSLQGTLAARIVERFVGGDLPAPVYGPGAPAQAEAVAGTYVMLRRPFHRTERALIASVPMRIQALPNGDLLRPALLGQPAERFLPLGDGLYQTEDGLGQLAARELNGRMHLFDAHGVMPADRAGFLDGPDGFLAALAAGLIFAVLGALAFVRALLSRSEAVRAGRGASLALDGAALVWMASFVLLGLACCR